MSGSRLTESEMARFTPWIVKRDRILREGEDRARAGGFDPRALFTCGGIPTPWGPDILEKLYMAFHEEYGRFPNLRELHSRVVVSPSCVTRTTASGGNPGLLCHEYAERLTSKHNLPSDQGQLPLVPETATRFSGNGVPIHGGEVMTVDSLMRFIFIKRLHQKDSYLTADEIVDLVNKWGKVNLSREEMDLPKTELWDVVVKKVRAHEAIRICTKCGLEPSEDGVFVGAQCRTKISAAARLRAPSNGHSVEGLPRLIEVSEARSRLGSKGRPLGVKAFRILVKTGEVKTRRLGIRTMVESDSIKELIGR